MNTRQLFQTAYSAARAAMTREDGHYESPMGAAMRATYGHSSLWRFKVTVAAARAAEMNRSYRVRSSVRLLHSNALTNNLLGYRARMTR